MLHIWLWCNRYYILELCGCEGEARCAVLIKCSSGGAGYAFLIKSGGAAGYAFLIIAGGGTGHVFLTKSGGGAAHAFLIKWGCK